VAAVTCTTSTAAASSIDSSALSCSSLSDFESLANSPPFLPRCDARSSSSSASGAESASDAEKLAPMKAARPSSIL
jgi:hypothetical protein